MKQFITDGKRVVKEDTKLEPLEVTTRIGTMTKVNPRSNIKTWPRHMQIRTDYESNERKTA